MKRLAAALTAVLLVAAPASAKSVPAKIWNCGKVVNQPVRLVLACGDGNLYFTNLKWKNWGAATATASGTDHLNDCTPYCAAGHFHTYSVRITVDKLRPCGITREYARLRYAYVKARPTVKESLVYTMPC